MCKQKIDLLLVRVIITTILIIAMVTSLNPIVHAGNISVTETAEKTNVVVSAEYDALENRLKMIQKDAILSKEESQVILQKSIIEQQIFMLYKEISAVRPKVEKYYQLSVDNQVKLDAETARLEDKQEKNDQRLQALSTQITSSCLSILSQESGISNLITQVNAVEQIVRDSNDAAAKINQVEIIKTSSRNLLV